MEAGFDLVLRQHPTVCSHLIACADDVFLNLQSIRKNPRTHRINRLELPGIFYLIEESKVVPRKRSSNGASSGSTPSSESARNNLHFINVSIPTESEALVEELLANMADTCLRFVSVTADGVEVLVKRKRDTSDWLAMYTFRSHGVEAQDFALTAWGSTPEDAIVALVYKWFVLLGEQLPEDVATWNTKRRFG